MENKEKMYHIGLSREDIRGAKYAILPGDPGRERNRKNWRK